VARAALAATAALRDAAVLLDLAVVVMLRELAEVMLRELAVAMLRELLVVMLRELLVVMLLRELLVVELAPAAGLRPTWGAATVAGVRLPSVPFPPAVHLIYERIIIKIVKKKKKKRCEFTSVVYSHKYQISMRIQIHFLSQCRSESWSDFNVKRIFT
jgi:hypothetical protein